MSASLSLDAICVPSENVVALPIEGNVFLFPITAGICDLDNQICILSEIGWAIWQKLNKENPLGQVVKILAAEYSAPENEICSDVLGFVKEMLLCGTCTRIDSGRKRPSDNKIATLWKKECQPADRKPVQGKIFKEYYSSNVTHGDAFNLSNPGQLELLVMKKLGVSLRTTVRGSSMHPFIKDQDVLTIMPLDNYRPGLGDVVAFRQPQSNTLFIHRIIKKMKSEWLLKGDNCPEADGVVPFSNIIGRVTSVERNGRKVLFCLGQERRIIALLSRGRGLGYLKALLRVPYRSFRLFSIKLKGKK